MTRYVVGFYFSIDFKQVALIRKNRPKWQAGFLNGIGGHIEDSDNSCKDAMIREFEEETGQIIPHWNYFANLTDGGSFSVDCFWSFGSLEPLETKTDEEIVIREIAALNPSETVDNLMWLVHLALDSMNDGRPSHVIAIYNSGDPS